MILVNKFYWRSAGLEFKNVRFGHVSRSAALSSALLLAAPKSGLIWSTGLPRRPGEWTWSHLKASLFHEFFMVFIIIHHFFIIFSHSSSFFIILQFSFIIPREMKAFLRGVRPCPCSMSVRRRERPKAGSESRVYRQIASQIASEMEIEAPTKAS